MMKRRWITSIAVLGSVVVLSLAGYAADIINPRFSAKIKVTVGGDENNKGSVSSYLNRELRSLNDVELVDDNYEWRIIVLALDVKSKGGQKTGVALSSVITQRFNNQWLRGLFKTEYQDSGIKLTSDLSYILANWINVGSTDDLQEMCKQIVVNFDTKFLEESRKSFRLTEEEKQRIAEKDTPSSYWAKLIRESQKRELTKQESPLSSPEKKPTSGARETGGDGRFIAYDNGTVLDTGTNLMWAAKDNGSNINWENAKAYCENYHGGGYTDWRIPTHDELAGLYDEAKKYNSDCGFDVHLTELIRLTCPWAWAAETRGSAAATVQFTTGKRLWPHQSADGVNRVLPVRSGK